MEETKLEKYLESFVGKDVTINIYGSLEGKYTLPEMNYFIEEDILTLNGKENYLKININQIYKFDEDSSLEISMDNDITVSFQIKK